MTVCTQPLPPTGLPAWPRRLAALALGSAALLAACGGGNDDAQFALKTTEVSVVQRAAEPTEPGACTPAGRYATRADAQQIERALEGDVVWLDVACCAFDSADTSVGIAHGLRADAPVFVTGRDARLAAYVANGLDAEGLTRVFLFTP